MMEIPADLQAAIDDDKATPHMRAKMVRAAFAARNWPNQEHPGTVRDFLEEHSIPIIDVPRGLSGSDSTVYTNRAISELRKK